MAYNKRNLRIVKYRGFYGVDYISPSLGRTIKTASNRKQASKILNRLTRRR